MITYDLSSTGGNLYEKLYKLLKDDILSGKIGANEKMPSKRTLAANLGVSTITVENAYDQLISEGYMYALPRKGYYAADVSNATKIVAGAVRSYGIKVPEKKADPVFNFSSNKMDRKNFPFSIWAKLMRENMSVNEEKLLEISPCGGVYELRAAIAGHLASFRGMSVDPAQIIVGAGTEYLYGIIVRLCGYNKKYCIENPGYMKLQKIYSSWGVQCDHAGMDDKGIVVDDLRKAGAQIAHVSPAHHFPTGISTPVDRRYELLAWAHEAEGRYIIEDDYDSEFRINGKPIPTLQSIDAAEKVIYMNTFSKSLASTIRISYMVLPVHLANLYYETLSFYSCTVSTFEQYTLAGFIDQGYFEKHINRMRLYYGRKRRAILEVIDTVFEAGECTVVDNGSGLHFILALKTSRSEDEIKAELLKHNIRIESIRDYTVDNDHPDENRYIINYSNMDIDSAAEYLRVLKACAGA